MKRFSLFIPVLLLLIVGVGSGCSSDKAKKPPEADHADEILRVVRGVFEEYDAGRFEAFAAFWAAEAREGIPRFSGTARHTFSPKMIEIDGAESRALVAWTCRWEQDGRSRTGSGTAEFRLSGSPLRIVAVEGDSPFLSPL